MDHEDARALALVAMKDKTPTQLVAAALNGEAEAWEEIVDRYQRLVWSVVRSYRLDAATAADVAQTVWLKLVENLERIRDPERLPAWLSTTARNEALRMTRARRRVVPSDFEYDVADAGLPDIDAALIHEEELVAAVAGLQSLDGPCQHLLRLLTTDPPLDYDTISAIIGRPKGSIGPTRARCLDKLRRAMGDGAIEPKKGPAT